MKKILFSVVFALTVFINFAFAENIESYQDGDTVKGMHLTALTMGSQFFKDKIDDLVDNTEMNAVVIDVKEIDGKIAIKGVAGDLAYSKSLPNPIPYVKELKERNVYIIARLVCFRDNTMPRKKPELAVKTSNGQLWEDYKKLTWLDPYNQKARNYLLDLAETVADMGFDEIQFDYIRFPSDGNVKECRYKVERTSTTASQAIVEFLKQAKQRLAPKNIKISIDVFGLTTTATTDMGIGQKIVEMTEQVDYVSPMVYPSHYRKGDYGIPHPNKEPYRTVYIALQGAKKRIPVKKLRPWLQDFSIRGVKYGPEEVQAQIQACFDCGVTTWLLWNPACKYTKGGLKTKDKANTYVKSSTQTINKLLKLDTVKKSTSTKTNVNKPNTNKSNVSRQNINKANTNKTNNVSKSSNSYTSDLNKANAAKAKNNK